MSTLTSLPEELFLVIAAFFAVILAFALCRYLLVLIMATGDWLMGGEFKATLVYCLKNS
jgi:hypothetical protein